MRRFCPMRCPISSWCTPQPGDILLGRGWQGCGADAARYSQKNRSVEPACERENSKARRRTGINVQVLSGVSCLLSGLFSFDVECGVLPGRCTARALNCWREHAKAQRRVFGVARKVAERMLHRYRTRIDDERGHHHGRSFDGLRFLALILFNLSVTKLIRNIRLQSFKKITAVTVLYAFVNLHDNCFTTRNAPFLSS